MSKYTTKQLQDALIGLYSMTGEDQEAAYRMTFDELHRRMGDETFDEFLDNNGI